MLEVSSTDIIFELKNDVYVPYNISLKNVTSLYLAYKIKSTKPDLFSVKQSRGLISPLQSENVEFSITDRAKEEFRSKAYRQLKIFDLCYQCSREEISKFNYIVRLLKLRISFNPNRVLKEEFGKKIPIFGNNLASSHTSVLTNSRTELQPSYQSMIQPIPLNNQVQCVQRLKQIELDLAEEKRKREQIYNTIEISKLKKGSSLFKYILPIILGILLSNIYQLSLKQYE